MDRQTDLSFSSEEELQVQIKHVQPVTEEEADSQLSETDENTETPVHCMEKTEENSSNIEKMDKKLTELQEETWYNTQLKKLERIRDKRSEKDKQEQQEEAEIQAQQEKIAKLAPETIEAAKNRVDAMVQKYADAPARAKVLVYTFPPSAEDTAQFIGEIHEHIDYPETELLLPEWLSLSQKELLREYQGSLLHFVVKYAITKDGYVEQDLVQLRVLYRQWLDTYRYPRKFIERYEYVGQLIRDAWQPQVNTLLKHLRRFFKYSSSELKYVLDALRAELFIRSCSSRKLQRQFEHYVTERCKNLPEDPELIDRNFAETERKAFDYLGFPMYWQVSYTGGKHVTLMLSHIAEFLLECDIISVPFVQRWYSRTYTAPGCGYEGDSADEADDDEDLYELYSFSKDRTFFDPLDYEKLKKLH